MNVFTSGGPRTIFDWAALRDEFRDKLDLLPIESLAIVYGLSCTVGYRDDDFVRVVDSYLGIVADPVRTRFELAYALGSSFWDSYDMWHYENINPHDPGYVGGLLDGLHDKVLAWLVDGLTAYSNEDGIMDNAFYLLSRTGMGDTFLEEEDRIVMEAAARKEISFKTSPGGRQIAELAVKAFEKQFGKNGQDKPDTDTFEDSEEIK